MPAIIIMISTIVIKGGCWLWCRLVKNSSVRALWVAPRLFAANCPLVCRLTPYLSQQSR
jgi:hypothetical protein